ARTSTRVLDSLERAARFHGAFVLSLRRRRQHGAVVADLADVVLGPREHALRTLVLLVGYGRGDEAGARCLNVAAGLGRPSLPQRPAGPATLPGLGPEPLPRLPPPAP